MLMIDFTLPVPYISENYIEIKIKLNYIFTFLCGASKGFIGPHKTFRGTTKKCENKDLIFSLRPGLGREGLTCKNMILEFRISSTKYVPCWQIRAEVHYCEKQWINELIYSIECFHF